VLAVAVDDFRDFNWELVDLEHIFVKTLSEYLLYLLCINITHCAPEITIVAEISITFTVRIKM